jgi:hypothetical protein
MGSSERQKKREDSDLEEKIGLKTSERLNRPISRNPLDRRRKVLIISLLSLHLFIYLFLVLNISGFISCSSC